MANNQIDLMLGVDASGVVKGTKQADAALKAHARQADATGKKVKGLTSNMNKAGKAGSFLKKLLPGIGGALILTSAIKQIAEFETKMSAVAAVTGAVGLEFEALQKKAREMGASTQFSAGEAAEGMKFLGMAGFETSEIIAGIRPALDLAKAGALGLGEAADIASNILSGFGISATEAGRVADVLAVTAASSNTSIQQLGDGMKYAAPIAASLGISLEDTAAAMGVLANAGLQGSLGGTGLKIAMQRLLDITPKAEEALAGMGLTAKEVNPEFNSMTEIIQKFSDANMGATEATVLFGARGSGAMTILTAAMKGTDSEFANLQEKILNSSGAASEMAEIMGDNLGGSFKALMSAVSELYLQLGDGGLGGILLYVVDSIGDFVRGLIDMNGMIGETKVAVEGAYKAGGILRDVIVNLYDFLKDNAGWLTAIAGALALQKAFLALYLTAGPGVYGMLGILATNAYVAATALLATATAANVLARAFPLLLVAYGSFKLGEYLNNEFESVQKFGTYIVQFLMGSIDTVVAWGSTLGELVLDALKQSFNALLNVIQESLEGIAGAISYLPFDSTKAYAADLINASMAMEEHKYVTKGFTEVLVQQKDALLEKLGVSHEIFSQMRDDIDNTEQLNIVEMARLKTIEQLTEADKLRGQSIDAMNGSFGSAAMMQEKYAAVVTDLSEKQKDGSITMEMMQAIITDLTPLYQTQYAILVQSTAAYKEEAAAIALTAKQQKEAAATVDQLLKSYEPVLSLRLEWASQAQDIIDNEKAITAAGGDVDAMLIALGKSMQDQIDKLEDIDAGMTTYEQDLQNLTDTLNPLDAITRQYTADQLLLNEAQANGDLTTVQLNANLEILAVRYEEAKKKALENGEASFTWVGLWDNAVQTVSGLFDGLWDSAFNGFEGFMDELERALKDFARVTFEQIFTKPIGNAIAGLAVEAWDYVTGGGSGGGGGPTGGAGTSGGVSGTGSEFDPTSAGGVMTYGYGVYDAFKEGASFGSALTPDWIESAYAGYQNTGTISGAWDGAFGSNVPASSPVVTGDYSSYLSPYGTDVLGSGYNVDITGGGYTGGGALTAGGTPPPTGGYSPVNTYDLAGNQLTSANSSGLANTTGGLDGAAAPTPAWQTGAYWQNVGLTIVASMIGAYAGQKVFENEGSTGIGATAGSMAGAWIGSAIPGIGTVIGAGIGAFVGEGLEKVLGDVLGFGGKKGNNWGNVDFNTADGTQSDAYGEGNWSGENGTNAGLLVDAMQMYAEAIGGSNLTGTVRISDRQGIRFNGSDGSQSWTDGKDGDDGFTSASDFFNSVVDSIVAESTTLDARLKPMLTNFEGAIEDHIMFATGLINLYDQIPETQINEFMEALAPALISVTGETGKYSSSVVSMLALITDQRTGVEKLNDAKEEAIKLAKEEKDKQDALLKVQKSFPAILSKTADETDKLIESFGGTTDQAVALNTALLEQEALFLGLVFMLEETRTAIMDAIDSFRIIVEEIDVLQPLRDAADNVEDLFDLIAESSDPAEIAGYTGEILTIWQTLFSVMGESIANLQDVWNGIVTTLSGTANTFYEDTLSPQELVDKWEKDLKVLVDDLPNMETPAEVEAQVDKINALTTKLWNAIPDDQQIGNLGKFQEFLYGIGIMANTLLTGFGEDILDAGGIDTTDGMSLDDMADVLLATYTTSLDRLETAVGDRLDLILDALEERHRTTLDAAGEKLLSAAGTIDGAAVTFKNGVIGFNAAVDDIPDSVTVLTG